MHVGVLTSFRNLGRWGCCNTHCYYRCYRFHCRYCYSLNHLACSQAAADLALEVCGLKSWQLRQFVPRKQRAGSQGTACVPWALLSDHTQGPRT